MSPDCCAHGVAVWGKMLCHDMLMWYCLQHLDMTHVAVVFIVGMTACCTDMGNFRTTPSRVMHSSTRCLVGTLVTVLSPNHS